MRISFCTTSKNRLYQLRQTLDQNLKSCIEDGNSEIVVLNYNSEDELDTWIRGYQKYIDDGVLVYGHEKTEKYFHASKAKNLAHLLARGEYVVNLDGDNFINNTILLMRQMWESKPQAMIHLWSGDWFDGTFGRIAMPRDLFKKLGGYDESFLPISAQDADLIIRANAMRENVIRVSIQGGSIPNPIDEKMKYLGDTRTFEEMNTENVKKIKENLSHGKLVANLDRKPVRITLNFKEDIYI